MSVNQILARQSVILMADDDEDDRLLAKDAMEAAGANYECFTVADGQELLDYLRCEGPYQHKASTELPSVILLDLNMPIMDGRETLKQLKADASLARIPVVILSTSSEAFDINDGYGLGASSYMIKPTEFSSMVTMMKQFNDYWFDCASVPLLSAISPSSGSAGA
jgi:two-component system response regulator